MAESKEESMYGGCGELKSSHDFFECGRRSKSIPSIVQFDDEFVSIEFNDGTDRSWVENDGETVCSKIRIAIRIDAAEEALKDLHRMFELIGWIES